MNVEQQAVLNSYDLYAEIVKQLIAVSSAIIVGSIALMKKDVLSELSGRCRKFLGISWSCFAASIVFGIFAISAMSGNLRSFQASYAPSITTMNVSIWMNIHTYSFLAGILGFTALGIILLWKSGGSQRVAETVSIKKDYQKAEKSGLESGVDSRPKLNSGIVSSAVTETDPNLTDSGLSPELSEKSNYRIIEVDSPK